MLFEGIDFEIDVQWLICVSSLWYIDWVANLAHRPGLDAKHHHVGQAVARHACILGRTRDAR